MKLSKYEIYRDAVERLSLPKEDLCQHERDELKHWCSHLNVGSKEELIVELQHLVDRTWDDSPSGIETLDEVDDLTPQSEWLAGLPRTHETHLPPQSGATHGP
jgi:hypothetical protein